MAANNFKPFATGNGANVTSQADYEALAALLTGFQSGKASSAQINKALRQSSTMAYVLAQFIADSASVDVLDNGAPATILASLKSGMTGLTVGRLLNIQSFPVSATYTPTSGTKRIRIRAWGGGGSGAGTATSGTGAAGGAGGGYLEVTINLGTLTSIPITVGKGGAGIAANSSSAGNAGGDTLIPLLGITAKGGGGGGSGVGGTPTSANATASLLVKGQDGQGSAIASIGGQGGAAFASSAGVARTGSSSDNGGYPGGASAGGSYPSGGTPRGSGSGADGLVIIEEYA